jgi:hypothetical protein
MTFAKLERIVLDGLPDTRYQVAAELLLDAMRDWPSTSAFDTSVFIEELQSVFGTGLPISSLRSSMVTARSGLAWQAETASSLLTLDATCRHHFGTDGILEAIFCIQEYLHNWHPETE